MLRAITIKQQRPNDPPATRPTATRRRQRTPARYTCRVNAVICDAALENDAPGGDNVHTATTQRSPSPTVPVVCSTGRPSPSAGVVTAIGRTPAAPPRAAPHGSGGTSPNPDHPCSTAHGLGTARGIPKY